MLSCVTAADQIDGGDRNDIANGGSGDDSVFGQDGVDLLNGDTGDDFIDGGDGNDLLNGGRGNDMLVGGTGNDRLDGSRGNDMLAGGTGDDLLFGGQGSDVFIYAQVDEFGDTIYDFGVSDRIDLSSIFNGNASLGSGVIAQQEGDHTVILANTSAGMERVTLLLNVSADALEDSNFIF